MGWDELGGLTPRMFNALMKRQEQNAENERLARDYMLAQIIATQFNTGFVRFDEWQQAQTFMPKYKAEAKPRRTSERELSRQLERMMERAMSYQARRNAN